MYIVSQYVQSILMDHIDNDLYLQDPSGQFFPLNFVGSLQEPIYTDCRLQDNQVVYDWLPDYEPHTCQDTGWCDAYFQRMMIKDAYDVHFGRPRRKENWLGRLRRFWRRDRHGSV